MAREQFLMLNVSADEMLRSLGALGERFERAPEKLNRAFVNTLNRALPAMKKLGKTLVTKQFYITSKTYNKYIVFVRAARNRPFIIFRAEGRRSLPLSNFSYKAGPPGVAASVMRSSPRTLLEKIQLANGNRRQYKAFMIKGKYSGKALIATREPGEQPEVVRVFFGPSFLTYLERPTPQRMLKNEALKVFANRFEHEAKFALGDIQGTRSR